LSTQYTQQQQQQRRAMQQFPHVPRRSVAASDDTWQIEMKCAFPGPTASSCCSCYCYSLKYAFLEPVVFARYNLRSPDMRTGLHKTAETYKTSSTTCTVWPMKATFVEPLFDRTCWTCLNLPLTSDASYSVILQLRSYRPTRTQGPCADTKKWQTMQMYGCTCYMWRTPCYWVNYCHYQVIGLSAKLGKQQNASKTKLGPTDNDLVGGEWNLHVANLPWASNKINIKNYSLSKC